MCVVNYWIHIYFITSAEKQHSSENLYYKFNFTLPFHCYTSTNLNIKYIDNQNQFSWFLLHLKFGLIYTKTSDTYLQLTHIYKNYTQFLNNGNIKLTLKSLLLNWNGFIYIYHMFNMSNHETCIISIHIEQYIQTINLFTQ